LADGGTALDAAIATNSVLAVVYPHMCGLGGDLFLLYYEAATGAVHCLNASGPAPAMATRDAFADLGLDHIPQRGPLPVTVPGTVAGWQAAYQRFGRLPFGRLLEPAAAGLHQSR
jgi:gamma-glutamyltranspeptidase/glutathione hydrolase